MISILFSNANQYNKPSLFDFVIKLFFSKTGCSGAIWMTYTKLETLDLYSLNI